MGGRRRNSRRALEGVDVCCVPAVRVAVSLSAERRTRVELKAVRGDAAVRTEVVSADRGVGIERETGRNDRNRSARDELNSSAASLLSDRAAYGSEPTSAAATNVISPASASSSDLALTIARVDVRSPDGRRSAAIERDASGVHLLVEQCAPVRWKLVVRIIATSIGDEDVTGVSRVCDVDNAPNIRLRNAPYDVPEARGRILEDPRLEEHTAQGTDPTCSRR